MTRNLFKAFIIISSFLLICSKTSAHCDSMEGPVVKACKKAIETGNVNLVLIWIREEDEQEVKSLFNKVMNVRKLNDESRELADNYFFETVVRIHRMGEGVPYNGIKPAGFQPEKGIEAADIALENNSVDEVLAHLEKKYHAEIKELFDEVNSKKNFSTDDIKAGREYVSSYVRFIHHVEELYSGSSKEHHIN